MNTIQFRGALTLSLLLGACGENRNVAPGNRQGADAAPRAAQSGQVYSAEGDITAIAGDELTISHGPVEGIGWPAMTMAFRAQSPEMAEGVSVGDRVSFAFRQDGSAYVLTSLSKAE
ncbi:copper-binding protein [Sphingomonas sp.]|uniref:copper-binding protein n=1 Tax=Sphingomonas sp. TaxID=28214 RepID=UPI0017C27EA0|nr:copper-binding protein [Sphingomonas sp.]MBA3511139.1 copper-binding protein [Sphingomonas sp.]